MYRTHNCGELRLKHLSLDVTLAGWVQRVRNLGGMTFIDLRDRYGITQLVINGDSQTSLALEARALGREFVIQARGIVAERVSKNNKIPTGDIELLVEKIEVLNKSSLPPFTIEDDTDGGDELRMRYRYLDLRRNPVRQNLELRHKMAMATRDYLDSNGFIEIETPVLIKSTPEGARDFVVPSRVNPGEFYALPQSPQVFKQLLMVAGYDRYFQIVKCFRDEDLRADRQPEFTQIDCEMAFVTREDVLNTFEGLAKHLFKITKGIDIKNDFPRLSYSRAIEDYGTDKPDTRFGMLLKDLTPRVKGKGFKVFDEAEHIGGFTVPGCAGYTRSELDALTEYVKRPQVGAQGLIHVRYNPDGSLKSSVDKFFNESELTHWATILDANPGDLMLVMAGSKLKTKSALSDLRLEMGSRLGLRDKNTFAPLWVVDFPLLEWDDNSQRFFAMHHPFTSPLKSDRALLETNPGSVRADAYDLVVNGVELGGGSIRIHDDALQAEMFRILGFTSEEARAQFGFLMDAFKYGAPPHGGIAFGFDRLVSLIAGTDTIRDVIAFPKNNSARDVMIDSPSPIQQAQLSELGICLVPKK